MVVVVVDCAAAVDAVAIILVYGSNINDCSTTMTTKRASDGAKTNQPLRKEEEDLTALLTPAVLVLP